MINSSFLSGECFGAAGRAAVVVLAFALCGCSISMPLPALIDNEPTGSIQAKATEKPFDPGDWPHAESALRAAMGGKATAEPARWTNPDTGRNGQFLAVAGPFQREGASCRAFLARIEETEGARSFQGIGCARENGEVAISDVAPWKGL
jgi:hypothetical protein